MTKLTEQDFDKALEIFVAWEKSKKNPETDKGLSPLIAEAEKFLEGKQ